MVVVPLLIGMAVYKRLPSPGRLITWLMVTWFITECLALYFRKNGHGTWNIYVMLSLAEIVIVTSFYRQIFISATAKSIIAWLAWIGLAVVITEYAWMNGPSNSITMLYESFFFFGMGLYAFFEMVVNKAPMDFAMVNVCIMVMFVGSGVYFASWHWMRNQESLFRTFAHAHAYLLIVCYSLFSYSIWKLQQ